MPGGGERIMEAGHDAQRRNCIDEDTVQKDHVVIGIGSAKNYEEHKNNLRGGRELAVNAGRKWPVSGDQQNHHRDYEDQHVPAEDEDGEPPSKLLLER